MASDSDQKSLKILNASAGSGKTYSLVKEYIKLLIEDPNQTKRFNQIIAMTFTNMAALEMKTRIVASLDVLSNPKIYLKKADDLCSTIASETGIDKDDIYRRSASIMKQMLHSYEDFSVMTIDKFNLRLIRSFSRDLDLPADFEVVLNENQVIEQVVDLLMSGLGTEEMKEFTQTVFNYSKENLEEGEGWDFRKSLISFGSTFSKEKDQRYLEILVEKDFNDQKMAEVRLEIKKLEEQYLSLAQNAMNLIDSYQVDPSKFPGGSALPKRVAKAANGWKNDLEPFAPTFKANLINATPNGKFFPDELRQALIELNDLKENSISYYQTLISFAKNFYNMSLLKFLAQAIDKMKKDERIIRISEFNKLISSLVRQEEAPFIYERLGTRYQHFLLDEFQDTSRLQWLNMVPLVHESLAQQKFNLIVGDPKQSIYRFKNGVAEQFVALPGIYNPEKDKDIEQKSHYFSEAGFVEELKSNWRSSPEIVTFNNQLFSNLRDKLPEFSKSFYNSVSQSPKSVTPGFVQIKSGESTEDIHEEVKIEILNIIDQCVSDNFKKSDLCILTETNSKANEWALILKDAGHKVISAESLLIDNDLKVNLTISYLKRRHKPSMKSEMKRFAEIYFRCRASFSFDSYARYIKKEETTEGKVFSYFDNDHFIIDYFGTSENFFFNYENIYDLVQGFYLRMEWDELKDPYLHHFADFIYDFEQSKGPDLSGMLDLYEEKKKSLAIQTPPSDDAIIVMTIHKSKGLEFPVVILPSCDFDISVKTKSKFLVESDDFILHTTLSASTKIEAIKKMHSEESENILTDKMNLCYVAFTRPEYRLYAFNYYKEKNFGRILHEGLSELEHEQNEDGYLTITRGSSQKNEGQTQKPTEFFEPINIQDRLWFPDIAFSKKKDLSEPSGLSEEQRFGNQFHLLMAELNAADELTSTLETMTIQGIIDLSFKDRLNLRVQDVFKDPKFNSLFAGSLGSISIARFMAKIAPSFLAQLRRAIPLLTSQWSIIFNLLSASELNHPATFQNHH
jgi:ATP-dependent exoDNAse (exonuclease V) beta subunit